MAAYTPESVARALFTYRPNGARNLALLLRADRQQEASDSYFAGAVRAIVLSAYGKGSKFPTYEEHMKRVRDTAHPRKPRDTRSAQQICEDLITALEK